MESTRCIFGYALLFVILTVRKLFLDNAAKLCYIQDKILTLSDVSCVKGANIVRML